MARISPSGIAAKKVRPPGWPCRRRGRDSLPSGVGAGRSASRTSEEALNDLRRTLPALPPAPRAETVRSVVEAVPGQADGGLLAVATTLSPDQRDRL
jgi:hypothetical protein